MADRDDDMRELVELLGPGRVTPSARMAWSFPLRFPWWHTGRTDCTCHYCKGLLEEYLIVMRRLTIAQLEEVQTTRLAILQLECEAQRTVLRSVRQLEYERRVAETRVLQVFAELEAASNDRLSPTRLRWETWEATVLRLIADRARLDEDRVLQVVHSKLFTDLLDKHLAESAVVSLVRAETISPSEAATALHVDPAWVSRRINAA